MSSNGSVGLLIALDETGSRISISDVPDSLEERHVHSYTCPLCAQPLVARKGRQKAHHFAHAPGTKVECDGWYQGMSDWHFGWQQAFPARFQEIVFDGTDEENKAHRADIFLAQHKTVVEFQHSPMSQGEFELRSRFYARNGGKCIWVFDVRSKAANIELGAEIDGQRKQCSLREAVERARWIDWSSITWKNAPAWIRSSPGTCADIARLAADGVEVFLAVRGSDAGANGLLLQVEDASIRNGSPLVCRTSKWTAREWIDAVKGGILPVQQSCQVKYVFEEDGAEPLEYTLNRGGRCPSVSGRELPWYASRRRWTRLDGDGTFYLDPSECAVDEDAVFEEHLERKPAVLCVKDVRDGRVLEADCHCLDRISEIGAAAGYVNGGHVLSSNLGEVMDAPRKNVSVLPKLGVALDSRGAEVFADDASSRENYTCPLCSQVLVLTSGFSVSGERVSTFKHAHLNTQCAGWDDEMAMRMVYSVFEELSPNYMLIPEVHAADASPHKSRYSQTGHHPIMSLSRPPIAPTYGRFKMGFDRIPDVVVSSSTGYDISNISLVAEDGLREHIRIEMAVGDKTSSLALVVSVVGVSEREAELFASRKMSVVHLFMGYSVPSSREELVCTVESALRSEGDVEWLWNRAAVKYADKRLHLAFGLSDGNELLGRKIESILNGWGMSTEYVADTHAFDAVAIMPDEHLSLAESYNEWSGKKSVHYHNADVHILLLPGAPADSRTSPSQLPQFAKLIRQAAKQCVKEKSARIECAAGR